MALVWHRAEFHCLFTFLQGYPTLLLEVKKLEIPQMFVKRFGNELSDIERWKFPMVEFGYRIDQKWDQNLVSGWLARLCPISQFSVDTSWFSKYLKNSTFQVLIFDSTACEIHYPYSAVKSKPQCNADNSKPKHENKSTMVETAEINESDYENKYNFLALLEEMGIYIPIKRRFVSKKDRERAIHIARLLKPRNPSFMVFLRSHSTTERRVSVPVKFVDRYLCRNSRTINLQVPDGRVLCVKIKKSTRGGFRLTQGWVEFSKEENLKQGDIGIFELIKMEDFIIKLSVYPAAAKFN
ncbi:B3 domain-containing protein REM19-like [Pistacia vera]|uniref:B3 domain-containing protein REM19-like n=1 Tax=Pistacia vera TaxID=55513 RepID=UPI0012635778|nr:B3 domain-containing protein REM19-like [Pistacia vera]